MIPVYNLPLYEKYVCKKTSTNAPTAFNQTNDLVRKSAGGFEPVPVRDKSDVFFLIGPPLAHIKNVTKQKKISIPAFEAQNRLLKPPPTLV